MTKPSTPETITKKDLVEISPSIFEIAQSFRNDMRVPARVFASQKMLDDIINDRSLWQLVNVATMPGIQNAALAMPDIHEGYGFPIGGVAATALDQGGVISPGGIGYDINCGVRLLKVDVSSDEIKPFLPTLATHMFKAVPSGVGRSGHIKLTDQELTKVLKEGSRYMLKLGYGEESDVTFCEENGSMIEADPDCISQIARKRGHDQLGTLGSGNHFLEIQKIDKIYDPVLAQAFGLQESMVTIMIHCGSRGLGHQTCTDYVRVMLPKLASWNIVLPDAELACAPFFSEDGQNYYKAMCASANFGWANRHMITHAVRMACKEILGTSIPVTTVYDISHNMGKKERHIVNGKERDLLVHRKGATRAFPAGRPDVIEPYRHTGHPVLVPGTMGTASYVLVGMDAGLKEAFGSSCHGAGRSMSRAKAKKMIRGSTLRQELEKQGIIVRCDSDAGLAEEAPVAYKDVDEVVRVIEEAKLAKRVARLTPIAVIKGG